MVLRLLQCIVAGWLVLHAALGGAVTTAGAGSTIVFPVVVKSSTFTSTISVFYPGNVEGTGTSITIDVYYFDALSTATPGPKTCTNLVVAAGATTSFTLDAQCALGTGSHHGLLVLQDAAAEKIDYFFAFARVESITGHEGFSIEGFPNGNFSAQGANVVGLKRVAAAPGYQSNCFVASLDEAVDYEIDVYDNTGTAIGSPIVGSLAATQEFRYLDIFSAVGAPAGDIVDARARFSVTDAAGPALIAFCTVQENVNFGADFRIAKSRDSIDNGERRIRCLGGNSTCTDVNATPFTITNAANKDAFRLLIRPHDFVKCTILGSDASNLELALLPEGPFTPGGTVLAGGTGMNSFYFDTGGRSGPNFGGGAVFFNLEIQTVASPSHPVPFSYGIRCESGNGTGNSGRVSNGNARGF